MIGFQIKVFLKIWFRVEAGLINFTKQTLISATPPLIVAIMITFTITRPLHLCIWCFFLKPHFGDMENKATKETTWRCFYMIIFFFLIFPLSMVEINFLQYIEFLQYPLVNFLWIFFILNFLCAFCNWLWCSRACMLYTFHMFKYLVRWQVKVKVSVWMSL